MVVAVVVLQSDSLGWQERKAARAAGDSDPGMVPPTNAATSTAEARSAGAGNV